MRAAVVALARRALVNSVRRPQFLAPLVVFPTLFLAINVGGLGATRTLAGFPHVDGFLDYQLAAAITQSLLLGGVSAGIGTALDIEGGFFDRLVASPTPRAALVLGRVLAASVIAALRSRSASTVQGIFPLVFVVLFISSAFFPLKLLTSPTDVIAQYNPLSFIANGMRQPIAFSNELAPFLERLLAAAAVACAAIWFSILALRGRLRDA